MIVVAFDRDKSTDNLGIRFTPFFTPKYNLSTPDNAA